MKKLFFSSILTFTCLKRSYLKETCLPIGMAESGKGPTSTHSTRHSMSHMYMWVIECLMLFTILSFSITTFAQTPEKMNYQGVARDNSGNELVNQTIALRFSIHQTLPTGTVVYSERHDAISTNSFGLFTCEIGSGFVLIGSMSAIDWGNGPYFIQIEMDPNGGNNFTDMGTSQLLSVPYALYAKTSGTPGVTGPTGPVGETGEIGPTGPTGPTGNDGIQGITGSTGASGVNGNTGPTGPSGANGLNGVTGPTGIQGLPGSQGETGPTGPTGSSNNEKPFMISYGPPYGYTTASIRSVLFNVYSDQFALVLWRQGDNNNPWTIYLQLENKNYQQRNIELDLPTVGLVTSAVLINGELYVLMAENLNPDVYYVFKYDANDISAGGILVALLGLGFIPTNNAVMMTSDGINIYFNYAAGNSINSYDIAKYSISGSTFVYQNTITCGSVPNSFTRFFVHSSGDLFGMQDGSNTYSVYRYDQQESLVYAIDGLTNVSRVWNWNNTFYLNSPALDFIYNKLYYEE